MAKRARVHLSLGVHAKLSHMRRLTRALLTRAPSGVGGRERVIEGRPRSSVEVVRRCIDGYRTTITVEQETTQGQEKRVSKE